MRNKIIYLLTGLLLLYASFSFRVTTIDADTLELIEDVETFDTSTLWVGFENKSVPKDIWYNFNKEFRYDHGTITEHSPDNPVMAIEAVKQEGRPLIKAVPFDQYRTIYDTEEPSSLEEARINYQSVFIHESFHCFQMERGLSRVHDVNDAVGSQEEESVQWTEAMEKIDHDPAFKKLWEAEYRGLLELYRTGESAYYKKAKAKKDHYITETFPALAEDIDQYIAYKELIEGTAQYVQDTFIGEKTGKNDMKYRDRVFASLDRTFYVEGSLKARILDRYAPHWKEEIRFDESNNLDKIMMKGQIL